MAIAVDPELPQLESVVGQLVTALVEAGCTASDLTVVLADDRRLTSQAAISRSWPPEWRDEVRFVAHHPQDDSAHIYLAATREGRPVYINRALGDADVVIPVGVLRLDTAADYRGIHTGWFPTFSNLETQHRFQSPGNHEWQTHQRRRRSETDEAGWLLGVHLVVQVLPGASGEIAGVWCGESESVARHGNLACREVWSFELERPANLAIAILDADPARQTWRQVARCLATASRAVAEGGVVVLWTELADDPGPALKALAHVEATEDEQRLALLKQRSADATAAKVIADCLQTCRVYLRSRLDDAQVEEIGLAPLHDAAELQRLVSQSPATVVIGSAQYAGIGVKQSVEA